MLKSFVPSFAKRGYMNWAEYGKALLAQCKAQEVPFQGCFELTPFCNFQCNMCYIRLTPEQAKLQGRMLNTQQWIRIAEEAKQMGTVTLEVTGGEAVTRPDFKVLYESFVKLGYLIHLRTNGYLICGDILELLKRYRPRKISISLYGASDETYKRVCNVSDGFSVVSRNILAMKEAGLNIRLSMTLTKENESDLPILKQWASDNDMSVEPFGALINPIRSADRSIDRLRIKYADEEFEMPDQLKSVQHSVTDRESLMRPFWLCRGFGALFCISWDGRMTLCNTYTETWEDPIKKGTEQAYHSLYKKLKNIQRPDQCATCQYIEFCAACPSQLQSATGTASKTSDDVCKFARRKYKYFMLMQSRKKDIDIDAVCNKGDDNLED